MMYTKGIRKIFSTNAVEANLSMVESMAEAAGFNALAFNSRIFIRVQGEDFNGWLVTCFHITDFSDEQV